jgi:hypothetical protein
MLKSIKIYRRVYELNYDGDTGECASTDEELCVWTVNNQKVSTGDIIQIDDDRKYLVTEDGTIRID